MLGGDAAQDKRQMKAVKRRMRDIDREDQKLYKAYMADVFDEHEFAVRRSRLKKVRAALEKELDELKTVELTEAEFEERKRLILATAEHARKSGVALDEPFDVKKRIVKLLVDKVELNVAEGWVRIDGITPERIILNGSIENIPTDKDSSPR